MHRYLLVPFVAAFSVLLRWCCGGKRVCCCRKRRHILRLRQAVLIGVLGGLVHVLVMVAVVTLPLLTALLLSNADALWNTLRVGFFGGSKAKATAADDHDGHVPDILLPSAGTSMLAVFVPVTFGAAVALVVLSDASASPLGLACAGTASVLRPLYAALCRRAINRCARHSGCTAATAAAAVVAMAAAEYGSDNLLCFTQSMLARVHREVAAAAHQQLSPFRGIRPVIPMLTENSISSSLSLSARTHSMSTCFCVLRHCSGHLDLLDRLHTHPGFASSVVGLDGPSTFELVLLTGRYRASRHCGHLAAAARGALQLLQLLLLLLLWAGV